MPQTLELLVTDNLGFAPVLFPGFSEPKICEGAELIFPVTPIVACQVSVLVPINLAQCETVVTEFYVADELTPCK